MTRIMKLNDHQTPHPTATLNTPSQLPIPKPTVNLVVS